jgi:Tetratricopeptide repeat
MKPLTGPSVASNCAEQQETASARPGSSGACDVCRDHGELDSALELFEGALEGFQRFGDRGGQSRALRGMGVVHRERGQFVSAAACFEESLAIAQGMGDRITEARVLVSLGVLHRRRCYGYTGAGLVAFRWPTSSATTRSASSWGTWQVPALAWPPPP